MMRVIALLLPLVACAPAEEPVQTSYPQPPYAACLAKPKPLPAVVSVRQLRARHDALDKLYDDCAVRALRNAQALRFYIGKWP